MGRALEKRARGVEKPSRRPVERVAGMRAFVRIGNDRISPAMDEHFKAAARAVLEGKDAGRAIDDVADPAEFGPRLRATGHIGKRKPCRSSQNNLSSSGTQDPTTAFHGRISMSLKMPASQ